MLKGFNFEDIKLQDVDINNLDFDNVGSWPLVVRIGSCIILLLAIVFASYWYHTKPQMQQVEKLRKEEGLLRARLASKQHRAANLYIYKKQIEQMQITFSELLQELPNQNEVPELLEDISHNGVASGLEFKLFVPQSEVQHDFYAELPIQIEVLGDYNQFARFISRIASLDRIVTMHDMQLEPLKGSEKKTSTKSTSTSLRMLLTAKTYRYTAEGLIGTGGKHD